MRGARVRSRARAPGLCAARRSRARPCTPRAIARVSSVLALLTTRISSGRRVCAKQGLQARAEIAGLVEGADDHADRQRHARLRSGESPRAPPPHPFRLGPRCNGGITAGATASRKSDGDQPALGTRPHATLATLLSSRHARRSGDHPRRRTRHAPVSADPCPLEAGRAHRRQVPTHRHPDQQLPATPRSGASTS